MLGKEQIKQAAEQLARARKYNNPGPSIPDAFRPKDADSALAIQKLVMEMLGEVAGGWKCAVPPPNGIPILSTIPKSKIHSRLPCPVPGPKALIEPEIAFVVKHDMPSRGTPYSDAEVRDSIGAAHYVIELLASRYADKPSATPAEILADAYNNFGLWVGPKLEGIFDKKLDTLHVTITSPDGVLMNEDRKHPSGHPLKAYTWLIHFLNSRGEGLKAGEIVTTGSYAGIVDAPLNKPVRVELAGIGVIDIELTLGATY